MYLARTDGWYLERIIWVLAGVVSLAGLALGLTLNPWWLILDVLVGVNLIIFGASGFCLMANILHALGARPMLCKVDGSRGSRGA